MPLTIVRNIPALLFGLTLTVLASSCAEQDAAAPDSGSAALPEGGTNVQALIDAAATDPTSTMFQSLAGQGFEIDAFKGKKVFLNFWATWCAPCIREIPAISRAADSLAAENYIFLLASDESPETINNFLADRDFSGNFIKLNGFFGGHGIDAVPSSVLYDEAGNVVKSWAGAYEWDSAEMLSEIRMP